MHEKCSFQVQSGNLIPKDGVAMGSPLGSVLAGIFRLNIERSLVPKLNSYMFMLTSGDVMWMTRSPLLK